ncbi:MAG TPA: hypothetical protein O0X27_06525, partial [Methanocorpusculum sp.]|nr:hypothetical protein [Methanocorpusculum sp.]
IDVITEPPFSPITDASVVRLKESVAASDMVVAVGMPIGMNNLVNISVLAETDTPVCIVGSFADFTHGRVTELVGTLKGRGAVFVADIPELVATLSER